MGDPGRLSPDDSERFREVKLRLVCKSGEGCMAKRLNTDRRLERNKYHSYQTYSLENTQSIEIYRMALNVHPDSHVPYMTFFYLSCVFSFLGFFVLRIILLL